MLRLPGILIFFASSCLLAQQVAENTATARKVIYTPVSGGKIVKFVKPVFPPEATMKAISGGVVV